jgi:hypothetical protein
MKTKLYGDTDLNSDAIKDMLESENCGVEEKEFVKAFSDEELETVETEYLEESKKLAILKRKLDEVSAPLKEQMKPLQKTLALNISRINAGGETVTEKVYCFPDYESKLMGLYDNTGTLVGTRAMTKAERQLHINSLVSERRAQ